MIGRLLLLLPALLGTSALYGMGTELQFIDGAELPKQDVYDEIPKAFGERVLVFPNGGRPDAVSFVFCEPYESLKDQVRTHFEEVASIREVTTNSQPKESKYGTQSNKQFVAQEVEKLRAAGLRTDGYSELQIVFPKYNIIDDGNQSSSLIMRLVNGRDIFGTPNSILTAVRLDDTLERMRTFHLGIPLPKKAHSEIRIVTDTETKMIQELERSIQKRSVEVTLTLTNADPYASFDSLVRFRRALDSCTRSKAADRPPL
jgi:hypothetical protein